MARYEVRRICRHYVMAVARESAGSFTAVLPSFYRVALARLRYGVGPRYYALFELARLPRSEWNDFVTDTPAFKQLLLDMSPAPAHAIAKDKILFHQHCLRHGLPAVPVVCVVAAAPAHVDYPGLGCVTSTQAWRAALADAPDELFAKPIDGTFGEGAFAVSRQGSVFHYARRTGGCDDVFAHLVEGLKEERGWLIQPRLRCHPELTQIMSPYGLGTVRLVTRMEAGRAKLLFAALKITVGDNATDNFHYGTTGNLLAAIDLDSGVLHAARGSTRKDWPAMATITHHPDTGHAIEGFVVPAWSALVRLTLQAQESLPELKSAGWDVALTPEGPVLVEANNTYSVDILQVAYRRGLKRHIMRELAIGDAQVPSAAQTAAARFA